MEPAPVQKQPYAVLTTASEIIVGLWMVAIFVLIAGIGGLIAGFFSSNSVIMVLEVAAGGIGIALAFVLIAGIMAVERLTSVDAHIRALLMRLGPPA